MLCRLTQNNMNRLFYLTQVLTMSFSASKYTILFKVNLNASEEIVFHIWCVVDIARNSTYISTMLLIPYSKCHSNIWSKSQTHHFRFLKSIIWSIVWMTATFHWNHNHDLPGCRGVENLTAARHAWCLLKIYRAYTDTQTDMAIP